MSRPRRYEFTSQAAMLAWLLEQPPQAWHTVILHDDDCPAPRAPCACDPDYVVEELTAENYLRGQQAEAKWRRSKEN